MLRREKLDCRRKLHLPSALISLLPHSVAVPERPSRSPLQSASGVALAWNRIRRANRLHQSLNHPQPNENLAPT